MTESGYQSKIIKAIEDMGGQVVNGNYTKVGEADLQCGYPIELEVVDNIFHEWGIEMKSHSKKMLVYLAVEVKTEKDYERIMSGLDEDYNIVDEKKLKKHEFVQMAKIRIVREKGGLALVAWNIDQIKGYIDGRK